MRKNRSCSWLPPIPVEAHQSACIERGDPEASLGIHGAAIRHAHRWGEFDPSRLQAIPFDSPKRQLRGQAAGRQIEGAGLIHVMTAASRNAFWAGAAVGEPRLPACRSCGYRWFPPTAACPRCLSAEVEWRPASGCGAVVATCRFHRRYLPDLDLPLPCTVLLVRLAEGPLFYANPANLTSQPAAGTKVRATFAETAGGPAVARFEPEEEQS